MNGCNYIQYGVLKCTVFIGLPYRCNSCNCYVRTVRGSGGQTSQRMTKVGVTVALLLSFFTTTPGARSVFVQLFPTTESLTTKVSRCRGIKAASSTCLVPLSSNCSLHKRGQASRIYHCRSSPSFAVRRAPTDHVTYARPLAPTAGVPIAGTSIRCQQSAIPIVNWKTNCPRSRSDRPHSPNPVSYTHLTLPTNREV